MSAVVVLNTTYEPLHKPVTVQHAVSMLMRGVAVVIEEGPERFGNMLMPKVLMVVRYVKESWKYGRRQTGKAKYENGSKVTWEKSLDLTAPFSLDNLLKRDDYTCAYCGIKNASTFDHVMPKSRGGAAAWENALAACEECNWFKADRTPEEAGLVPLWEPWVPTVQDLHWGRTSQRRMAEAR